MTFTNENAWDRVIRILLGLALGYAAWTTWPGALAITYTVLAAIALVTGIVGWCPFYAVFGLSTQKKKTA